jgi:hypothetical protein
MFLNFDLLRKKNVIEKYDVFSLRSFFVQFVEQWFVFFFCYLWLALPELMRWF